MKQQKKPTRSAVQGVVKRAYFLYAALVLLLCLFPSTALAADDPLTVVNNLSDFIFGLVRAIGMILLGFGVVQIVLQIPRSQPACKRIPDAGRRRCHHICQRNTESDCRMKKIMCGIRGRLLIRPAPICLKGGSREEI